MTNLIEITTYMQETETQKQYQEALEVLDKLH